MNITLNYLIKEADSQKTIAQFLSDKGYSSRLVVHLRNTEGSFSLNGVSVFSRTVLKAGDCLTVIVTEKKTSENIVPVDLGLNIVFEDDHVLIVNKPAGIAVHPSQGNFDNTLANAVAWYLKDQADSFVFRAVNRLDKETSGLVLLAKNMVSACILSDAVAGGRIRREYSAIVCGKTEVSGTVAAPIARKDGSTIERICDEANGESAVTHYRTLGYNKDTDLSFLRLLLETGRTHQIRVHMKSIGHPLPGDFLYNPDYRFINRQPLHSQYLRFPHPITGETMEFEAPLPEDMKRLFPDVPETGLRPFFR